MPQVQLVYSEDMLDMLSYVHGACSGTTATLGVKQQVEGTCNVTKLEYSVIMTQLNRAGDSKC